MEKLCASCSTMLSVDCFNKNGTLASGKIRYQSYCKECNKVQSKKYYRNNLDAHRKLIIERRNKEKQSNQQYIIDYLLTHHCVDCGNSDVRVLEFDHVRGTKSDNISLMIRGSFAKLKLEIEKCDVRCANCHKIRTSQTNGSYRTKYFDNVVKQ